MAYPYPYQPQPQPSASAPMPAVPTTVFGPQYCAPYPVDLAIVKKVMTISDGNFVVTDINGNIVFKVKGSLLTLRDRRVLIDAAGNPIATLRRKVKGSWFERSCVVYAGESNTIVAQMHKKHTVQSILIGKDNFTVTVYPNIDYAFIVALIVILDEINEDEKAE